MEMLILFVFSSSLIEIVIFRLECRLKTPLKKVDMDVGICICSALHFIFEEGCGGSYYGM